MNWQPVTVPLSSLTPWERNPKRISKSHARRLLELWERLGQFQTVAIGPAGEVYDGHQRLSVLKAAFGGAYEVKALRAERALSEDERAELVISAHSGTVGTWDWDALAGWDAGQLQGWGFDAETLGNWRADVGALDAMLAAEREAPEDVGPQIDRAEELRVKWGVESGQVWALGEHRVVCGDCTDRGVVERVMGGERAEMVWTDPPYGVNYDGGQNEQKREKLEGDTSGALYGACMTATLPHCLKSAAWYVWFAGTVGKPVYDAVTKAGYTVRAMIVWNKTDAHYGNFMAQYMQKHEPCLYCVKDAPPWNGATNEVTVWDVKQPSKNEYHPTEKPIELAERAISNSSDRGALVADWFLGSGTTLIACERLGRRCRGIEISPAYVAVTLQRWADLTGKTPDLLQGDAPALQPTEIAHASQ